VDSIGVLVGDPQYLMADALARALDREADLAIIEEHPTGGLDVIASVIRHRPDVAVIDYWLPGSHGPAAVRAIRASVPDQRILVLSAVSGPDQVRACLQAGAAGFLPKSVPVTLVAEAIRRAHAGENPVFKARLERMMTELSRRCLEQDIRVERLLSLTPRELAVLREMSSGRSVPDIARRLSIRSGTVRGHIHSILRKTDAHNQLEAVATARREGLIRDE
jgi:two-component system response regulator DesR